MSGYRVMAGMGVLERDTTTGKPDDITVPVYLSNATKDTKTDCLHQLIHRLGAGVTLDISETRNNNYVQEMGLREFTTATSGMYEVDFTISGIFSPKLCENWLGYAFMMGDENEMKALTIEAGTVVSYFKDAQCTDPFTHSKDTTGVYAKLVVPGKGVEGNNVSKINNASYAYDTYDTDNVSIKFYSDSTCTTEYTGTSATKHVWIKAVIKRTASPDVTLTTTEATHFEYAKDAYIDYYKDAQGTEHFTETDMDATVYIKVGDDIFGQPMLYKDAKDYADFATGDKVVKLFGYKNLTGPKYFDFGYQKINSHASGVTRYDGHNEMGVIVGCIVESASMSYESGSDAGVKFQLSCHGLRNIKMITNDAFDYASILDPVPTEVFVGGCVSVYNKDTDSYEAVAQTDSAAISITNNTQKLGNCLRLNYSSYAIGALTYDVSTSTYSNDPNKYLKYFYGYAEDMMPSGGETIGTTPGHYYIAKQPVPIGHMKIRTDDTSAIKPNNPDIFLDINMTDVYVGDMSNSYSVDSAIMDEPSLRAKKTYVAVGYKSS